MNLSKWMGIALAVALPAAQAQKDGATTGLAQAKDIVERTLSGQSTGNDAVRLSFQILNRDGSVQMERAAHLPFYTGEVMRIKVLSGQSGTLHITNINAQGQSRNFNPLPVQAGLPAFYPSEPGKALEFAGQVGVETLRVNFVPQYSAAPGYGIPAQTTPGYSPPPSYPPSYPPTAGGYQPPVSPSPVSPSPSYPPSDFGGWGGGSGTGSQPLPPPPGVAPYPAPAPTWPSAATPAPVSPAPGTWAPGTRPSDYFTGVIGKSYAYAKDIRETVLESNNATYLMRPTNTGPLQFDITIQHRNQ